MLINNFLTERESVRHFKNKKIKEETIDRLSKVFELLDNDVQVNNVFGLYPNGDEVYTILNGHAGYNGVMIEAPCYISVSLGDSSDRAKVSGMYKAEDIISLLSGEGLGSCWVGLFDTSDEIKEKAFGNGKHPDLVLAVGYPKARNPFVKEEKSERLPVEDIVYRDKIGNNIDFDELEQLGLDDVFYYVRFAPSTLNAQPWRFVMNNSSIDLYLKEIDGKLFYEDMGIIMYYFEKMYNMSAHKGEWIIEENFKLENGYVKIATIGL